MQGQVTAGHWMLPVVLSICTLCWVLSFFVLPELAKDHDDSSLLWQATSLSLLPKWAEHIASYAIYAVIGYLLIEINNLFSIIRMRASIQTAIYLLMISICPKMHMLYSGDVAAIAFIISIYFLFKSYQQTRSASFLFYSFFFIGAGSIIFPPLTFFSVVWIFESYRFQSLTMRSFFGAILGWTMPYWLLFGHAVFYNQMAMFYHPFVELMTFEPIFNVQVLSPWELAMLAYLFVMFIVSTGHCVVSGFEDKIRTRSYLQFLMNVTFYIFLFIALQPSHCSNLLPILMITVSFLTGHFFALTNSKTSNIFFIVAMSSLILLFGFNVWTLL